MRTLDSFLDKRWHKPLFVLTVIGLIVLLFLLNQSSIYRWSCLEESNSASCFFVGKNANEQGQAIEALKFLNRSCDLNYGLGCWELYLIHESMGKIDEAKKYRDKACSLDVKELCELRK